MKTMEKSKEKPCELPNDIVISILGYLPVKSLMRFLCVSKPFSSQIGSTTLVITHLNHSQNSDCLACTTGENGLALYLEGEPPCKVYNFPNDIVAEHVKIVGSCNGVLCLIGTQFRNLFLWNPLVSRIVKVPPSSFRSSGGLIGFDCYPTCNDFKLVKLTASFGNPLQAELYTLSSNTWKILSCPLMAKFYLPLGLLYSPAYVNGMPHWLVHPGHNHHKFSILCFDMGVEAFKELDLPDQLLAPMSLIAFKGLLSVVPTWLASPNPRPFPVWVMKDYGKAESWVILFNIDFDIGIEPWLVVGLRKYGEVLLIGNDFELYVYSKDTQETRKLTLLGESFLFPPFWGTYKESVALLDVKDENVLP